VPFTEIAGRHLVVEEKLDGANAGISFTSDGQPLLQSRGHYLTGGPRERQFAPLKAWVATIAHLLWPRLRDRYIVYGEWLYAKHTVFYDALPHYFCEFDVFDRVEGVFLSTPRRAEQAALDSGVDPDRVAAETDGSDDMEGLYIKVEENGIVTGRYKWVRAAFLNAVLDSGTHWMNRPIVPNQLRDPAVMYAGV